MSAPHPTLNELERDALTELVNIGVSRAAAGLRKMVHEQVILSVPSVEMVSHETAVTLIKERERDELVAVRQNFAGAFSGRALLIFPQANGLDLVRVVVGSDITAVSQPEMEQEALAEIGNIILSSCLATMANMLHRPFDLSLPEVLRGSGEELFEISRSGNGALVLFLYINFSVRRRDIRGYIAMLLDVPSIASIKQVVDEFIAGVIGDDPGNV